MAEGVIPVVLADGLALPFEGLLDWSSLALRVPEAAVADIPRILANFSLDHVCRMRHRVRSAYSRFLKSPEAWIAALEELELHRAGTRAAAGRRSRPHALNLTQPSCVGKV